MQDAMRVGSHSSALRSVRLLDVVSSPSAGPSVARLVSTPVCDRSGAIQQGPREFENALRIAPQREMAGEAPGVLNQHLQ